MDNERQPQRIWPDLSEYQEWTLRRLTHVLAQSPYTPVTWTKMVERIVYEKPWYEQQFKKVGVTFQLSFEEKQRLIRTTVARLYQALADGDAQAEQKARVIIRRFSSKQNPESNR